MSGNSFGKALVLTTFGESHGVATGGVLDGFPSNIDIDPAFLQAEVNRRKPGSGPFSSSRVETDSIEILSGIFEGKSTGAPIAFLVRNTGHRPEDYDHLKNVYRPSHADYTYQQKYGIRDHRGGGRASARETLARVVGGAFAKILLDRQNIAIHSRIAQIGPFEIPSPFAHTSDMGPESQATKTGSPIRDRVDPYLKTGYLPAPVLEFLEQLKKEGDSTGGVISCNISGAPVGLGEPVFDKLQADLAKAMLSIGAAKGFEYGSGFQAATMKGSEHNDPILTRDGKAQTLTNHSGGIQGGISNGEEIYFRVAFKPVPTLFQQQNTIASDGSPVSLQGKGRHDVCLVFRALPIVEAMAALVLADHLIRKSLAESTPL